MMSEINMYSVRSIKSKFLSIAMVIAMALTMTVSAFASDIQPWYADTTDITGTVNYSAQTYTVTITGAADTKKITFDATLYQKQLLGRKQIGTLSGSSSSRTCSKSKSVAIEKGKTYVIEVTAQVYSGGVWDTVKETITAKT